MQTDFNFTRSDAVLASAIFESFCRIEKRDRESRTFLGMDTLYEEAGTCHSRWLTAAFLFSIQTAAELESLIDWDLVDGVFTYEHLETIEGPRVHNCRSLPAALWNAMSFERWADMSEGGDLCDREWLRTRICGWAQANDVPLVAVTLDKDMSSEALKEKYAPEHPDYPKSFWLGAVGRGYENGYWDYVRELASESA